MTRIRMSCPVCGLQQDLRPDEIELLVASADNDLPAAYGFTCQGCARPAIRTADERALEVLLAAGVTPPGNRPLSRPGHPEDPPDGPPFTLDDLLELHLLLERDDWFALLHGSAPNG